MTDPNTATAPLVGVRVVECSSTPAAMRVGGMLADYGADVVVVEPPGGSTARERFPVECAVFHRGKRSIVLDLGRVEDRDALARALTSADVLIEDWAPGAAPAGLYFADTRALAPQLIHASITGFGSNGTLAHVPAEEAIVHALVGTMAEQIGLREGPIFEGLPFASIGAGYLASIGILGALWRRAIDGVGRHVDTSLFDGALAYHAMFWGDTDADPASRDGALTDNDFLVAGSNRLICGSFLCADERYISVHTGAVGAFGRLMKVLGLGDRIPSSESGLDMGVPLTAGEQDILHREIHDIFARETSVVWEQRLLDADVCGILALPPGEVFDEPQTRFNEMVVTVADPVLGPIEQVAPAIKFGGSPAPPPSPAPVVGDSQLAAIADEWAAARTLWCGHEPLAAGPLLAGVKILDVGAFFAGPYASRLLAELGADVIKLETIAGDPLRGLAGLFRAAQAGKRSIAVDLKDAELQPALHELIRWADVIHHNMRPGAAERVSLGAEEVAAIDPSTIYGYAPGWGSDGPYARRQSFEPMMSGYVGANFEVAGQFNPPLYPQGNADPGNGMLGAIAMLLSLLHRGRTGQSARFENPQLNATLTHVAHIVRTRDKEMLNAGKLDPLQFGIGPLERLYETADGWICLAATADQHATALGRVLGIDVEGDKRFAEMAARQANEYALSSLVDDALRQRTTADLIEAFAAVGVPAAEPVGYHNHVFMRDPEQRRIGRVAEVDDDALGKVRELALLVRVSGSARAPHRLAPGLGEHTGAVLESVGYSRETIAKLRSRGSIVG
jgi:crotonobetainyl-CoA:carnitine CoA-transferase CaiB-like acyl-CoA transferase